MAPPPPPSSLSFSVRRCKPELLTLAKPTPRELKQLSDIDDQQGHRCDTRIIMFYKNRIKETEHHHHHHHVDPITRLSCGGFVLAIRLNHAVSDELGLVQFLKATADMAKGSSSSPPRPVWQTQLLNAREPPQITCALHHQYEDMSDNNDALHQSFFFGTKQMTAISNHLPPPHLLHSSSTLQVLTAFLWRCHTIALQIDPNETVGVTFMVDVRGKPGLNLPPGYYGNSSVSPAAVSNAGMLCKNPLEYAVELVKKDEALVTEKYIRSVADFLVVKGRPPYSRSWNFIVSDTTCAGFGEVDLGGGSLYMVVLLVAHLLVALMHCLGMVMERMGLWCLYVCLWLLWKGSRWSFGE